MQLPSLERRGRDNVRIVEPGDLIGGRYRLEKRLAAGGMGEVWTATHVELDTTVAVKFLHTEQASAGDAEARFRREAKAAAKLKSPSIVQIYDFGIDHGAAYMAMELLEGEDLSTRIERQGPMPVAEARALLEQVAIGLALAHDAGIVHRDIKPSNLFLTQEGDRVAVKILDFGIAKETGTPLVSDAKTSTGVIVGSPHYMSPEQARGLSIDPRSDLWSLGVVLYEMLTGVIPFEGHTLGEIIAKILADPIPLPSSRKPSLAPLDDFFRRALARDRDERFADISRFMRAFADASTNVRVVPNEPFEAPAGTSRVAHETSTTAVSEVARSPRESAFGPRKLAAAAALLALAGLGVFALSGPAPDETAVEAATAEKAPAAPSSAAPEAPSAPPPAPVVVTVAASASVAPAATSAAPKAPLAPPAAAPPRPSARAALPPPKRTVDDTFGIPVAKP